MQNAKPGQANTVAYDLVNKSTGSPITAGTVTAYLLAMTGDNAGKWWDAAGGAFADAEASAGAMANVARSLWTVSIAAGAWTAGVAYQLYAHESGSLNCVYTEQIVCGYIQPRIGTEAWTYDVTDGDSDPIADVTVWITTDSDGDNVLDQQVTNESGRVTFYLNAGTYYVWRRKAGVSFSNPDTEVVT